MIRIFGVVQARIFAAINIPIFVGRLIETLSLELDEVVGLVIGLLAINTASTTGSANDRQQDKETHNIL